MAQTLGHSATAELLDIVNRIFDRRLSPAELAAIHARHAAREAEIARRQREQRADEVAADVAQNNADVEFRLEVIEEMIAAGIARPVALNRTSTQAKLMAEAKAFGVI